jgi:hypothetical protein
MQTTGDGAATSAKMFILLEDHFHTECIGRNRSASQRLLLLYIAASTVGELGVLRGEGV